MLCETSDKRVKARFWFLVNIKNIENLLQRFAKFKTV